MNFISAEQISKSLGERILFNACTLGLNQGDRIALVGVNGSGKTTLLKILAGIIPPDSGNVSIRKDIKVGYLFQEPTFVEYKTVLDYVLDGDLPQLQYIRKYESLAFNDELSQGDELRLIIEKLNELDAWDVEHEVHEILGKLGLGQLLNRFMYQLSGGQRKRVAMARLLINKPDVLLLDEPTNHLDIETIEWLENIIDRQFNTLIVVSHDRYFLNAVSNIVAEIDNGQILKIRGDYAHFLEKKEMLLQAEDARLAKLKNQLKKELDWVRRQPKARGTKSRSRLQAFEHLQKEVMNFRDEDELFLPFKSHRQGGKIVEVRRISKQFDGKPIVRQFTYHFQKNEKIGLIGKNGVGKTTLLQIIAGEMAPDTGDVVIGETISIGYYRQENQEFDPELRLIDYVKSIAEHIELDNGQKLTASAFLSYFLFKPSQHYTPLGKLSGGEKKRLQLISVLIKNPNFLILDEPTNDLDIHTLNVLEDFLERYQGTAIIVSHDRYFMDRVVDHLLVLQGNGEAFVFNGNYSDFKLFNEQKEECAQDAKTTSTASGPKKSFHTLNLKNTPNEKENRKRKLSYRETKELEEIKQQVHSLEGDIKILRQKIQDASLDYEAIAQISVALSEKENELEMLTLRWLELEELPN